MDTYMYQQGGFDYRSRNNEYISDPDLYRKLRPTARVQDGYVDQFSFQRHHRFYSSVPRNYDRRKQEYRREVHYEGGTLSYDEVKETAESPAQYQLKDDANHLQMYERSQNEVTGNSYEGNTIKRQHQTLQQQQQLQKKVVNYGTYQSYDDGGFQTGRTVPTTDGANVVVNLNATGNGVNTVLSNGTYTDHGAAQEDASGGCCLSGLCLCSSSSSDTPIEAEETGLCKPPLLFFLLVLLIILFVCVSTVLLYINWELT
ncbi:hypothetical protein RUM44_001968 [Polyplax serrata]|uniref:Uncharacterized protein n=1 Tax=Polyplax serrata TaxID=468196 RepID=A0ABR1ALN1_POLSC